MDKLNDYEIDSILENLQYDDVNSWEQTRLRIYSTAQMMSKKQMTPQDLMKFPWEEKEEEHKTSITNEEIEDLEKKARTIQKKVYGK
jgi:hypothetical protein